MTRAGAPSVEEIELELGARSVRLVRAGDLAGAIDPAALLSGDAVPEPPYWMHLWPGAVVLARMLRREPQLNAARVLELGCGLALPALCAAQAGATVVAADRCHAPLALVRASAVRNGVALAAVQMDWEAMPLRGGFDLCLGADIGYDESGEPGLVRALTAVLRSGGRVWLADSVNTWRQTLPQRLVETGFTITVTPVRQVDEGRPVWVRVIEARRG